jgi:hypothetical protein
MSASVVGLALNQRTFNLIFLLPNGLKIKLFISEIHFFFNSAAL